jgi:hypothetical protein
MEENPTKLAAVGPKYISRVDLDPSDQLSCVPVEKADAFLASDPEKSTAAQTLGLEADIKAGAGPFFEVTVHLDAGGRLPDGVVLVVFFRSPRKVQT